jgi:2,3-bisphosphoglycerate-dependent phosphoglycerate mutase
MKLYLIRHAESENNARPAYERTEDPGLTPLGRLQANNLAKWLAHLPFDELVTSPFRRTLQTTKAILDAASETSRPVKLSVWHDVFERGGCFIGHGPKATQGGEGFNRDEILKWLQLAAESSVTIDASITNQGWWGAKQRETDEEAATRARRVVDRIEVQFAASQKCIVIVTHADFIRLLLAELIGDAMTMERLGPIRNAGITKLNLANQAWELDWLNSVSHLPPKLC